MIVQLVKNPPAMRETWVRFLGGEDLLEKGKATHSSILAENSMDRGAWQATIGHNLATEHAAQKETYLDWNSGLTVSWVNFGFP